MSTGEFTYHQSQITKLVEIARNHYYQLVLLMGGHWRDRSFLLKEFAEHNNFGYIALSLPLSKSLLERTLRDRPMVVADHLNTLLAPFADGGIALDHIEILFDPALQTDPLRLIQMQARYRGIIASWPGVYDRDRLIYAEPGHPEYYSKTAKGLLTYYLEVN
jgi:hypothetical protein